MWSIGESVNSSSDHKSCREDDLTVLERRHRGWWPNQFRLIVAFLVSMWRGSSQRWERQVSWVQEEDEMDTVG